MEKKLWTANEIREKLLTDQRWLERGVLAIFERQTSDEQHCGDTIHRNDIGFDGSSAKYLSYVARWIKSGKHLNGKHLDKTRRKMVHFAGQLAKIANGDTATPASARQARRTTSAPKPIATLVSDALFRSVTEQAAVLDIEMKNEFARQERLQEQRAFMSDPDFQLARKPRAVEFALGD